MYCPGIAIVPTDHTGSKTCGIFLLFYFFTSLFFAYIIISLFTLLFLYLHQPIYISLTRTIAVTAPAVVASKAPGSVYLVFSIFTEPK